MRVTLSVHMLVACILGTVSLLTLVFTAADLLPRKALWFGMAGLIMACTSYVRAGIGEIADSVVEREVDAYTLGRQSVPGPRSSERRFSGARHDADN